MSLPPLTLAPLTELDSVNNLLLSIGQSPVNSMDVPGVKDVSIARMTLHNVSREVQQIGWWFNSDRKLPILPDVQGHVRLPADALQVRMSNGDVSIVDRAGKLYDTSKHSPVFPTGIPVELDVITFLAYTDLPQVARNYIERRAGRVFQANIVASQLLYQFTKEMELEARAEMDRNQLRVTRPNILYSPTTNNRIHFRR